MDPSDPAYAGQKDYGPFLLSIYDWWVLQFMTRAVWRSPTRLMVERYSSLIGQRHLDIGPGTGYFVDRTAPDATEVTLLDPNTNVLDHCSKRLDRFDPVAVEADVLKPLPVEGGFDSIALSFVLHCLPGPIDRKAVAVRNAANVLSDDGVFFGGTVLGPDEHHTPVARSVLRVANRQRLFDNRSDTLESLGSMFNASFEEVEMEVVGSTAMFSARGPRRTKLE